MPAATGKGQWRSSKAKAMLREQILLDVLNADTDLDAHHKTDPEFIKWPISQFKRNTQNLIQSMKNKKQVVQWRGSPGRAMLKDEIIAGTVHEMSDPEEIHQRRDEYRIFPLSNFKTNMENLLNQVITQFERLQVDAEAYGHDIAIIQEMRTNNPPLIRPWHRTRCPELLAKDIEDGKHLAIDPSTGKKITPMRLQMKQKKRMEKKKTRVRLADRVQVAENHRHCLDRVEAD
ncbi:expressed unknown protein [Seminavis robusta]|uniref:Uncharacterized protein n=1 Tax=Seminavis robusta TaxID=568900 RepID=A0A9N8DRH5_9STRA|nr:expressed unknown protein [Seminavis robusta]|eukprot:Sro229_g092860.1 n/a (232) ;mRNA; r:4385-5155